MYPSRLAMGNNKHLSCLLLYSHETTLTVQSLTLSIRLTASPLTNCTERITHGHHHIKLGHAVMRYTFDVAAPQGIGKIKTGTEVLLKSKLFVPFIQLHAQQTTTIFT